MLYTDDVGRCLGDIRYLPFQRLSASAEASELRFAGLFCFARILFSGSMDAVGHEPLPFVGGKDACPRIWKYAYTTKGLIVKWLYLYANMYRRGQMLLRMAWRLVSSLSERGSQKAGRTMNYVSGTRPRPT